MFSDQKNGQNKPLPLEGKEEMARRLVAVLRQANISGVDLTEALVMWSCGNGPGIGR